LFAGYSKRRSIVKNVNFNIAEGELVAIMGPSGSGKTTLLRTLVQQAKQLQGELLINNEKLSKKYFHRMGYVPQDDVLIKDLSVYDNMYYYYRLHFGKKESDKTVDKLISKQLRNLGIIDIKHNTIFENGKYTISGGQRKRLNIALELLKDVDLILVDEPTSGLSSLDSENIIEELKQITRLNKIIIINIHQPSASMYKQFDQVIVFNEDGNNIYTNKASEVLKIFKLVKTEDAYMFNEIKEDLEGGDPELLLEIQADEKSNFWNLFSYLNNFTEK
jgi:ABC-type multidrug transport system ATPase subunit